MGIKTILCYGDSNTYGYNPADGMRYPIGVRWTSVLQGLLNGGAVADEPKAGERNTGETDCTQYRVIEEGCNGRTTVFDDPVEGWKNGLDYLKPCLNSHKPIDIVIMMLGSNDLKRTFNANAADSARGAEELAKTIIEFTELKQGYVPEIILVSPPNIGKGIADSPFSRSFAESAVEESHKFATEFSKVAEKHGCRFLEAASIIEPSELDCLHLMPEAHARLAEELATMILQLNEE